MYALSGINNSETVSIFSAVSPTCIHFKISFLTLIIARPAVPCPGESGKTFLFTFGLV